MDWILIDFCLTDHLHTYGSATCVYLCVAAIDLYDHGCKDWYLLFKGRPVELEPKGKGRLPRDVYSTLLDLNICSVRPTRRECRAGRDKQRPISVIINQRPNEVTVSNQTAYTTCRGQVLENLSAVPPHNKSKITFSCLNVQSLRNKPDEFKDLVLDNKLDVVAITETWLYPIGDETAISQLTPTGYTFQHIPRCKLSYLTDTGSKHYRRGGGVGILYNSTLTVNIKSDINSYMYSTFECMQAEICSNSTSMHLVIVYRPEEDSSGHKQNFGSFLDEFESMIVDLLQLSDLVITGDFNVHFEDSSDSEANRFKSLLSSNSLSQHIKEPTHRQGHCIDLLITREISQIVSDSDIYLHPGLSWHHAIMCSLNLQRPKAPTASITTRRLKTIDISDLRNDLRSTLAELDFASTDVESCVESYNLSLSNILDKHAPTQT